MKMRYSIVLTAILSLGLIMQARAELVPGQPYGEVINGSIEAVDGNNIPEQWTVQRGGRFGQRVEQSDGTATVETAVKHGDSYSLRIESMTGPSPWWRNRVFVKPFSQYRLTGWVKTENVTTTDENLGAGFRIRDMDVISGLQMIRGTQDWSLIVVTFNTEGRDSFYLDAVLGNIGGGRGGAAITGKAWFDDISLELVSSGAYSSSITINASKETGPIMNDMIYGQFIEHLGRCIYGGIWAEMLSDRKFYPPVDETRRSRSTVPSAWMAVGGADSVVNMTWEPHTLRFSVQGVDLSPNGTAYILTSDNDMNYNQPGEPMRVEYTEHGVSTADNILEIAPVSATILVFPVP